MTNQIRLGAIFWLLTIEFFITQFAAMAAWPSYDMFHEDISNLGLVCHGGGTCSPLNLVFNGGMILNGLLVIAGIWLTRKLWPTDALTTAALWLLAVGGGVGSMLVGLFPLNVFLPLHMAGAVLALLVAGLGMLALGTVLRRNHRGFALYTLATGAITLAAFMLYALEIYLGLGRGIMERIAAWPHTIWYMAAGTLILRGYFAEAPE